MFRTCTVLAVFFTCVMAAQAGGPPVMYAVVEKVVLSPTAESPDRIQIWGSFTRGGTDRDQAYDFGKPVYGYLYLNLDPANDKRCRAEWAKWQQAAGTGKAVALGLCHEGGSFLKAKIHKPDEKPDKPDQVYSVKQIELFGDMYADGNFNGEPHVKALLAFAKERRQQAGATTQPGR
jgi:hypothetical protein